MTATVLRVAITLLLFALTMSFLGRISRLMPVEPPRDDFLSRHWKQPIAPQGDPPGNYSPLEASLAPDACGNCHSTQYADWRSSLHSRTMGPGILWQFRVLSQEEANDCMRCHAPLAEQKALTALRYGWKNKPTVPVPQYVGTDLDLQGLTCAGCHVRRHQRFGPPAPGVAVSPAPHDGFVAEEGFRDSRFCAVCHQFPEQGRSLSGKLIENTYAEWQASPAAQQGNSCQSCHMPAKQHSWRGIHDPDMVARGIRRELEVRRIDDAHVSISATLSTPGVGHYFPTYIVPKVTVALFAVTPQQGARELTNRVIGRTVSVDMQKEWTDTRIPPGGSIVLKVDALPIASARQIKFGLQVNPAEHYIRMFTSMLGEGNVRDEQARSLLREALTQAKAATYTLSDITVNVPLRSGEVLRAVAN